MRLVCSRLTREKVEEENVEEEEEGEEKGEEVVFAEMFVVGFEIW